MKSVLYTISWFFGSIALILGLATWYVGSSDSLAYGTTQDLATQQADGQVLGAEVGLPITQLEFASGDARPLLVTNFLTRYNSRLTPHEEYGKILVAIADRHEIDFRLLPAIAMQESGLCKAIPENSFNCLGLGVHSKGTWHFNSFAENFEAAAKILRRDYIDIGLTTPEQIMSKYTPSSNGSWAASVNQWMAEMRYDDRTLGRELKTDANVLEFATPSAELEAAAQPDQAGKADETAEEVEEQEIPESSPEVTTMAGELLGDTTTDE